MNIKAYRRKDGKTGIRNHTAVIATCSCSSAVVSQIARDLEGVCAYAHSYGCGVGLEDTARAINVLKGVGLNPNIGAVVLVGLGCESISAKMIAPELEESGKRVETLVIQEDGGSAAVVEKGRRLAGEMQRELSAMKREELPLSSLVVGLECGGSDALSGVTANPAVGLVSDWLVEQGAAVILSETTEMIGAVHLLTRRAAGEKVARRLEEKVKATERQVKETLGPLAGMVIAPGNMDGGMSTIAEKSVGCIAKGGSKPVVEVIDYAAPPSQKGLVVMDTPGYDVESMAGMVAGGAQLIIFTTGRGTPAGFPGVPVIKVVSNSVTYRKMAGDIDIDAGAVIDEGKSLQSVAGEIIALLLEVTGGRQTRAEINDQGIFAFLKQGPSF